MLQPIQNLFVLFLLFLFVFLTVKSCPTYPIPIKLNQNDEVLTKAYKQVDELIQSNLKLNNITSFIATMVYMDEIVWSKTYGNINPLDDTSPELTIDSVVKVASITKLFTSLMMFKLRDDGIVSSLDDDINKYYPQFKINNIYGGGGITFRELASHQSGLPRNVPCNTEEYGTKECTEEIILERLSKQFLLSNKYSNTHYSNTGYSLLGRVLGQALNKSNIEQETYESYIKNEILNPLQLNNSTFNYGDIDLSNLAIGYTILDNGSFELLGREDSGWNIPAGGLYSTARDICKFMMFWLNGNNSLLEDSTLNESLLPISLISDGLTSYGTPFEMYYDQDNNIWLKSKAGISTSYRTQLAMAPPLKLGLFFSSQLSIQTPDLFTRDTFKILIPAYESLLNSQSNANSIDNTLSIIGIPNELLVGNYSNQYGSVFNISIDDNGILLGSFGSDPSFYIIDFEDNDNFPYVKRIEITYPKQHLCWALVDGANNELIYFNFENSNNYSIKSVQVIGQILNKETYK